MNIVLVTNGLRHAIFLDGKKVADRPIYDDFTPSEVLSLIGIQHARVNMKYQDEDSCQIPDEYEKVNESEIICVDVINPKNFT